MNRKIVLTIAAGVLILAILACVPVPGAPTAVPTSPPTSVPPTARPTVAPTATPPPGGGESGGGKGAQPTATPPPGGGEPGGGKGGGGSTNRPATVTLVNNSGETVCYVYISPTTSDSWGDDLLGASETIATGSNRVFEVTAGTYDLRADDCDHNVLDDRRGISIAGALDWTIAGGGPGPGGGGLTVTLNNNSGQTVCYVYISPSTSSEWGDDWLGSDVVSDGDSYTFQVPPGTYDFKAEDCSHNMMDSQFGIALSSNWSWTINPISGGSATLTVNNNSGTSIYYLYISPSTSSSWGDDQLGSSTIAAGGSYTFNVTEGTYDLKAEDSSHNVIATQFGFYISGSASWTVTGGGGGGGSATVTLANNSGQTVCYVYISLSTDSSWGSDWLGADTVSSGASRTFSLATGTYDLKAEDCSHNVIDSQFGIAISGSWTWTIGPTGGGGSTTLTVYNSTGTTIYYFYISPSTSSSWGSDQLGSSTIPAGGSYTFNVSPGTYDLKAEDSSNNVLASVYNFAISGATSWTATSSGGGGGSATLTVYNNTSTSIFYFYISPSTSSEWGSDQLGSSTIPAGGSYTFNVAAGTYDLKAEDSNHNVLASTYSFNISGAASWTATSSGGGGGGATSITLNNNSGQTVCYVYISLSTSTSWGSDWLGSDVVSAGGSYTFYPAAGTYDLKAEDCSHNAISTLFNQNITGNYTWNVP